jgi:cell division protein ZapB
LAELAAHNRDTVSDQTLKLLEQRVDELAALCRRLSRENKALKSGHHDLTQEHARLVEKTQIARARIEAMIGRLKSLERA